MLEDFRCRRPTHKTHIYTYSTLIYEWYILINAAVKKTIREKYMKFAVTTSGNLQRLTFLTKVYNFLHVLPAKHTPDPWKVLFYLILVFFYSKTRMFHMFFK